MRLNWPRNQENTEMEMEMEMEILSINPKNVYLTRWSTQEVLTDVYFQSLKYDIASYGCNVVPIKVRPFSGSSECRYELVYGHRRHQACLELGLDVLAIVEIMNDAQLFNEMVRENRFRTDPTAYARGSLFAKALYEGLFPSERKMFEKLDTNGIDDRMLLSFARLPPLILETFQKPSSIKENWVKKILAKFQSEPEILLSRAKYLAAAKNKMTDSQIYRELTK